MNLQEQIGALDVGVDQLIQTVQTLASQHAPAEPSQPAAQADASSHDGTAVAQASADARDIAAAAPAQGDAPVADSEPAAAEAAESTSSNEASGAQGAMPELRINRPSQNEITMSIGENTVALNTVQIGQLIEELANARASMTPEPPPNLPQGWRFVSTRNPMMAVQKQSNGDRLLVLRHTGHSWVPFTFSPDVVIQLYMLLTQK